MSEKKYLAIFCPYFDNGGVEHMLVNLSRGMASLGHKADFIVGHSNRPYLGSLPEEINIIELGSTRKTGIIEKTVTYLHQSHPSIILSAKEPSNKLLLRARTISGVPFKIFLRSVTNISKQLENRNFFKRVLVNRELKHTYRMADGIIAVSDGVAEDISKITNLPRDDISVIPNPVITPDIMDLAKQPIDHDWFCSGKPPVIIGIGRLGRPKNFSLLVKAFAEVRKSIPCRLVILGNGRRRERLLRLARRLKVDNDFWSPGFIENPYPYIVNSRIFVLSSLWEGSPNALTESLALGIPVVSTDCPSGPREILQDGRYGQLVPLNDVTAMAQAIIRTLDAPPAPDFLKNAVKNYTMENSARQYLQVMGIY